MPLGSVAKVLVKATRTGQTTVWASGLAANGVKVHNGSVWVSTLAAVTGQSGATGNLVRIPFGPDRTAGPVTVAANVPGMDDFAFTGSGDTVLAAQNPSSQVSLVRPDGTQQVVLTAADGLDNPTAVAMRGSTIYVADSAFNNGNDPNLVVAHLQR
jgi:hypothetical protein